jgi:hypothetical protein
VERCVTALVALVGPDFGEKYARSHEDWARAFVNANEVVTLAELNERTA